MQEHILTSSDHWGAKNVNYLLKNRNIFILFLPYGIYPGERSARWEFQARVPATSENTEEQKRKDRSSREPTNTAEVFY